jgi:Thioredoxin-like
VERLQGQPFVLLGVNSDADREALKMVIRNEGLSWRSFWDGGSVHGPIATQWNVRGWPTIYVLDAKGILRFKNVHGSDLDRAVDALLAEIDSSSGG